MSDRHLQKLDPREQHFQVKLPSSGANVFLRYRAPETGDAGIVLYVHGATFSSALSIAHRFDGVSWRDDLNRAGFHVWALDMVGFGHSDFYPEMAAPAESGAPLGRAAEVAPQVEAALRFIAAHHGGRSLSLIAHSWGTMPTGLAASAYPELIDRIVFFGPITRRAPGSDIPRLPAWKTVTLQDQWARFTADTPPDESPVMLERHFQEWGERYLDADPDSRDRMPPGVKVPLGPTQEIQEAWGGQLAYDPGRIQAPVAIIRGAWDSLCTDQDAAWLFDALKASPIKRDVKLSRGGHLMHLEEGRAALYRTARDFLLAGDTL